MKIKIVSAGFIRLFIVLTGLCVVSSPAPARPIPPDDERGRPVYSTSVGDTFILSVSLPVDYASEPKRSYPVVYVLDANVYFGVFKAIVNTYSQIGLTPEVIVVGIGYKNLAALDTLRDRDYTFPTAKDSEEMKHSGGADKYLRFFTTELIPMIEKRYRTMQGNRTLFGHSLGGYFVGYALLQHLRNGKGPFQNYIAASPSLDYNDHYLPDQLSALKPAGPEDAKLRLFTTYGQLETEENKEDKDPETVEAAIARLDTTLTKLKLPQLKFRSVIFSNLAHMETAIPSFVQGLNWVLGSYEQTR